MSDRPSFTPIARRTVSEEIRDVLATSIREGHMSPGSRLPTERDLSHEFGVARTSVREAIHGLITLGLLEKRGNRAYVVEHLPEIQLDGDDRRKRTVHELFEVRRIVEVPMARLAACRATEQHRAEIDHIADLFQADMALDEFRRLDRDFHSAVARACGNATLAELYAKVLEQLFRSTEFEELLYAEPNRAAVEDVIRGAREGHLRIAKAIRAGDAVAVAQSAEYHLDQVEDQMISRMV